MKILNSYKKIAKEFIEEHDNVKVYSVDQNQGALFGRHFLVNEAATGDVVCFLGGDDYLTSDCISNLSRYYDEDTSTDIVHEAHVSGYKMKTITRKDGEVVTYRDMHSLSVGDIVEDVDNGTFHIVAGFGFEDITSNIVKEVA